MRAWTGAAAGLLVGALCLGDAARASPADAGLPPRASPAAGEAPVAAPAPVAEDSLLPELEYFNNGTSRLLYLYLRGLALHERGHWALSNQALAEADALLEDLYTHHLTREAGALLLSDNVVEYRGERFESAYLHYYKVLNYLNLGELDEAVVECRRLNHKLQLFADSPEASFPGEPFLQYLTGTVYSAAGEWTDAEVSFRSAGEGFDATPRAGAADSTHGRLHLFIEGGSVPLRVESALVAPIYREEIVEDLDESRYACDLTDRLGRPADTHFEVEYLLKVAVPRLVEPPGTVASARVLATRLGESRPTATPAVMVSDLGAHARRAFEERKSGIWVRAAGRALTKYLATRKARTEGGKLAGELVNLAGVVTENADTRSWTTLPGQILMASMDLAPGVYRVDVVLSGVHGERHGFVRIPDVPVSRGRITFRSCRVQ